MKISIQEALAVVEYRKDQDPFAMVRQDAAVLLAAEVRRLRDDAASTAGKIIKMTIEHDWAIGEAKRLREENERLRIENAALRADSARIDWLADVNNTVGSVVLPRHIVEQNISSLRQAIDTARSAKTLPDPAP